ncbi:uncharacterized protein TM35_000202230 [Trypanosoma theileri]|uniref:Zinc transporter n=1 Tax=Trypanosoma theileri TaxID=67003 RepID=A0A1X0NSY2_9TRYP|nr:uncharacterized protein TM35_000202230 [Trypanosoma theileri]ORC87814.1 hypothetical protein TM35_000202230 [Trypanosoma theileri]
MFIPAWFVGSELGHQCAELLLAAIVGVLLYYIPLCIAKRQGNIKIITLLEPVAQAIAAGVVSFSCFAMLQPLLPSFTHGGLASPDVLYFLGGMAAGGGLVLQTHHYFGDASSNAATAAMLAHGAAEGAGLGLLVGTPAFAALFQSQVLHGVPDGMLVATASLERSGLLRTLLAAAVARAGQAGAFYAVATCSPAVSEEAVWTGEGVAFGSMAVMMWQELAQPAKQRLGKVRAAAIATIAAAVTYLLFD